MHDFAYLRAADAETTLSTLAERSDARLLAGGTDLLNLMKDGIARPGLLVDIGRLDLSGVRSGPYGLHLGALTTMSEVAADPTVRARFPMIAQALERSASPQLRNMATVAGNLLQRTRCPYFRAETPLPCNKRQPGSGCAAQDGDDRAAAIFGSSPHCVAVHPSDLAVALSALDAWVLLRSSHGRRRVAVTELYRVSADHPELDTVLTHGELVTAIQVPTAPPGTGSAYVKVRDRAAFGFGLVTCAAVVALRGDGRIGQARIALGGVAAGPWRLTAAEHSLEGLEPTADRLVEAVRPAFAEARPGRHNAFKVEFAERAVVRALTTAAAPS